MDDGEEDEEDKDDGDETLETTLQPPAGARGPARGCTGASCPGRASISPMDPWVK